MLSGTFSTPVRELVLVTAGLSNLTFHDITLVLSEGVSLQPDRTLRDYYALRDAQGFLVTVRSSVASSSSTPPGTTVQRPTALREPVTAGQIRHVPNE